MKPMAHELQENKLFSLNKSQFLLDTSIIFLNYRPFGPYPKPTY
jgi:hypothetical protein